MYYVYILRCADATTYTGCTENLDERLARHSNGYVPATKAKLPFEMVFYCAFNDKYKAYAFEKYLKSGSGRAFMRKRFIWLPSPYPPAGGVGALHEYQAGQFRS